MPESMGGADLDSVSLVAVNEALKRTAVPFTFPPDSPNLHMMMQTANDEQQKISGPVCERQNDFRHRYLEPQVATRLHMRTRAVRDGDDWSSMVGRWVSNKNADFSILMAVTDPDKGARGGITAFLLDKGTPGFEVAREIDVGRIALTKWSSKTAAFPTHRCLARSGRVSRQCSFD